MTTQTEEKKRSVKFKDKDGQSFIVTVEITHRNGYPEFTASGDYGGGGGQCDEHIKPKNEAQKKLIEIWNKWHLNGMNAGTKKQSDVLKVYEERTKTKLDYDGANKVLNSYNANGEPLTVLELEKIKEEKTRIQSYITVLKKEIETFKIAIGELSVFRTIHGAWVKVSPKVLELSRTKKRDVKQGRKFYDNYFQVGNDIKALEKEIVKLNKQIEKIKKEELNKVLLGTLLYDIHPETEEVYQYGCGWIQKKLPSNFWEQLQVVLNQIEETEKAEHVDEKLLSDFNFKDFGEEENGVYKRFEEMFGSDADKALTLGISEDLTIEEALNEIEVTAHDDYILEYAGCSYLVGDDEEMDLKWDDDLENYIDECILHELPEQYQQYFDNEAWKIDARRDGRGHSLNSYDGGEEKETINGVEYFIYRN